MAADLPYIKAVLEEQAKRVGPRVGGMRSEVQHTDVADLVAEVEDLRRHRDGAVETRRQLGAELDAARDELRRRPTPQAWDRLMREAQGLQGRLNTAHRHLALAVACLRAGGHHDEPGELAHG